MKKSPKKKPVRRRPVAPSGPYCGFTEIEARALLHRKISGLSCELPEVPSTGTFKSREGDEFGFTQYADVLRAVAPLFTRFDLTFTPYTDKDHQTQVWNDRGMFFCRTHFALTDITTGYQMIVPGAGMGMNKWWSLDSAMTLALKHALLQALMIRWDNTGPWEKALEESFGQKAQEDMIAAVARETARDTILNFFGGTNGNQQSGNYVRNRPATGQGGRGKPGPGNANPGAAPAKA